MDIQDMDLALERLGIPHWTTGELGKAITRRDLAESLVTEVYNDGYRAGWDAARQAEPWTADCECEECQP